MVEWRRGSRHEQAHRQSGAASDQHAAHTGRNVSATLRHPATPTPTMPGHDKHAGHDPEMFRRRFWLSLLLTIPLVVDQRDGHGLVRLLARLPGDGVGRPGARHRSCSVWGGWPFLAGGVAEVRDRQPGMMLLIAMAITVAYVASLATSLGWFDLDFWWELAALVTIMLLGHWQEMKAIGQAQGALAALAALLPDDAERVDADGTSSRCRVDDLRVGDVVLVRAGRPGAGRRRDRRRRGRARRVDDHRRVQPGRQDASATGWWPARCRPTRRSGCGSTRSATTPRWPASSAWSPRPRPVRQPGPGARRPVRRAAVLRRRRRRGRHVRRLVGCSATPTRRSCAPSPCW